MSSPRCVVWFCGRIEGIVNLGGEFVKYAPVLYPTPVDAVDARFDSIDGRLDRLDGCMSLLHACELEWSRRHSRPQSAVKG